MAGNKWSNILPESSAVPYGNMLHIPPTIFLLLAAKQEPYKKAYLLTKNIETFSGKKSKRMCSINLLLIVIHNGTLSRSCNID